MLIVVLKMRDNIKQSMQMNNENFNILQYISSITMYYLEHFRF